MPTVYPGGALGQRKPLDFENNDSKGELYASMLKSHGHGQNAGAMDKEELARAIVCSGGGHNAIAEIDAFWPRIELLLQTERYWSFLVQFGSANDKSNFLALVLEVTVISHSSSSGRASH